MNKGILSMLVLVLAIFAPMAFSQTVQPIVVEEEQIQSAEPILLVEAPVQTIEKEVDKQTVEPKTALPKALVNFATVYNVPLALMEKSMQNGPKPESNVEWFLLTTKDTSRLLWGQYWGDSTWRGTIYLENKVESQAFGSYYSVGNVFWADKAGVFWGWFHEPGNVNKGRWQGGLYGEDKNTGEKLWWIWDINTPVNQWPSGLLTGPAYKLFE